MSIGRLNHVGIATPSIEKSVEMYVNLMGATKVHDAFDLPPQGVRVCFVDTPNSQIELIEPLGENSPIAKFLEKNPQGGQHHVCFEVADIHVAKAEMEAKGAKRSEEHTSELQSLMRISYAVFCLKKKRQTQYKLTHIKTTTIH